MAILKYMAVFVLGGAVGGGVGWIFASKKKDKWCTQQIEEMRAYYEKKAEEEEEDAPETESFTEVPEEEKEPPKEYVSSPMHTEDSLTRESKKEASKAPRHDYAQHYKGGSELGRDDDYDENYSLGLSATEDAEENQASKPYAISELEFGKDRSYKTMTLNYYMDNGVITIADDQDEEVIEDFQDVERLIGDTITEYGFDDNDEDTLYIRNEKMGTEYMIMKMFTSYVDG